MLGGMDIRGKTDWILFVTKTSLTREVMRLDFPTPSSPQTQIIMVLSWGCRAGIEDELDVFPDLLEGIAYQLPCCSSLADAAYQYRNISGQRVVKILFAVDH
jgi:hypothetical protein